MAVGDILSRPAERFHRLPEGLIQIRHIFINLLLSV
jgi:hypothetical protein